MITVGAFIFLAVAGAPGQAQDVLKVDPLLVYEAAEAWKVITKKENPVWPGWNASSTPVLIYLPGVQDLLINHPKPPPGFVLYTGPIRFPKGQMLVKDGPTLERFDGQNTSRDVNGVQTLVVADTLSARRQTLEGLVQQARGSTGEMSGAINNALQSDPYDRMAICVHEAFHVYQHHRAPGKGGNEMALVSYPSLSVENNVGYALEADALHSAVTASAPADVRKFAVQWLAARLERRKTLTQISIDYEDGTEFNEGLAKYTEYPFLLALEKRKPSPEMWLIQGFRGYGDLSAERMAELDRMRQMMAGQVTVNGDLYGASPVRMRLYYSGMGIGILLDRLGARWHDRILQPGTTLTGLAEEAIHASPAELQQAWAELKATKRYAELRESMERLAQEGTVYTERAAAEMDTAPAQLVIDYSGAAAAQVQLRFTPFGILRVDGNRVLFRLLPVGGKLGDMQFMEDTSRPVLQDNGRKQLVYTLKEAVTEATLDHAAPGWRDGPVKLDSLKLPGVTLTKVNGVLRLEGKEVVLQVR